MINDFLLHKKMNSTENQPALYIFACSTKSTRKPRLAKESNLSITIINFDKKKFYA